MLEKEIQSQFKKLLKMHGFFVMRHNVVTFRKGKIAATAQDSLGMPDLVCCCNGRFYAFEVKTLKGKQSEYQRQREIEIRMAGGDYYLVRSVDQGAKIIAEIMGQLRLAI